VLPLGISAPRHISPALYTVSGTFGRTVRFAAVGLGTAEDIRKLIIKLAKENEWGYTRILGELRKLNIRSVFSLLEG